MGKTWSRALACFGPDDLAQGLRACVECGDPWPPTLPEFIARCRPVPPPGLLAPYHAYFPKALPEPDSVKEHRRAIGRAALAEIKAKLGVRSHAVENRI